MAKTKQGAFPYTYHHIEAPTVQDEDYGKKHHKRKLVIPSSESGEEVFRHPLYYYLKDNLWNIRRKVDGQNLRVYWDGEQALWNGKSDNFTCSSALTEYMNGTFLEEIFEEKFGRDKEVLLFGEHMGPKSQGNELGLEKDTFYLYDVRIGGFWLAKENIRAVAGYFGIPTVFDVSDGLDGECSLVNIIAGVARGAFKDWEGIVAVPNTEVQDQKGHRIIVKVKNKDYLRQEKGELNV